MTTDVFKFSLALQIDYPQKSRFTYCFLFKVRVQLNWITFTDMTITYTAEVATSSIFCLLKLLFRWDFQVFLLDLYLNERMKELDFFYNLQMARKHLQVTVERQFSVLHFVLFPHAALLFCSQWRTEKVCSKFVFWNFNVAVD